MLNIYFYNNQINVKYNHIYSVIIYSIFVRIIDIFYIKTYNCIQCQEKQIKTHTYFLIMKE